MWQPIATVTVLIGLCTLLYVWSMADRLVLFRRGLASGPIMISDERARAVPDPNSRRTRSWCLRQTNRRSVADLIGAMSALEYPAEKLQVLLLLEADDDVTITAAQACGDVDTITIGPGPPADPRTKPKACNYNCTSRPVNIVTIYDAEDPLDPCNCASCGRLRRR